MRRQVLVLIGAAALAGAVTVGCERDQPGEQAAPRETIAKGQPAHRVESTPAPCKAGAPCTVALRLTALGQYKVNKEYPFKFVPAATTGVTVDNGAFAMDGDRAGTMTVTFQAAAPGPAKVSGTFKLSVCSESECRIEDEPVSVEVAVGT